MPELWAGTDAGKAEHHCVVIEADGKRKLSRRVADDETALLDLSGDVLALSEGGPVTWAIDSSAGGAALVIALLTDNRQQVLYIPGRPGPADDAAPNTEHASAPANGEATAPEPNPHHARRGCSTRAILVGPRSLHRTIPWPRTAALRPSSPTPRGWDAGATSGPSPSRTSGAT
ncbi:IS110 family transposase [Streptomyces enissocaesilis]|uniref:IS110 family transposase n=1 Tax=Streptomyces enissocaesilis TaxID=332589 RepID=UPI003CD0AA8F